MDPLAFLWDEMEDAARDQDRVVYPEASTLVLPDFSHSDESGSVDAPVDSRPRLEYVGQILQPSTSGEQADEVPQPQRTSAEVIASSLHGLAGGMETLSEGQLQLDSVAASSQ